jgi:hypothetical protein
MAPPVSQMGRQGPGAGGEEGGGERRTRRGDAVIKRKKEMKGPMRSGFRARAFEIDKRAGEGREGGREGEGERQTD